MIRRVKTQRTRRIAPNGALGYGPTCGIHIPAELVAEAQFCAADEVNIEAAPGIIVIGPATTQAPAPKDSRRVDHDRIESTVEEICERMQAWPHRDLIRLSLMCGIEMKLK